MRNLVRWQVQYADAIERKIMSSCDLVSLPKMGLSPAYLQSRAIVLRWALRYGHLWIGDGLKTLMCLALNPGNTFFDVGANIGGVTQRGAWLVGQRGQVHSFEPSPSIVRYLRRRVACLRLRNVVVNDFALGKVPGTATLYEFSENYGGASSLRPEAWPGHQHLCETKVVVKTLDDYMSENKVGPVRLVKIDVQGAEVDALHGSTKLLSCSHRPILFVEVEKDANLAFRHGVSDLLNAIDSFGYEMFSWRPQGILPVQNEDDIPETGHDDVICLCPDQHVGLRAQLHALADRRTSRLAYLFIRKRHFSQ